MVDFNTTSSSASLLTEHKSQASTLGLDISNDNKTQHQAVIKPSTSSMRDAHSSNSKVNLLTCIAALSTGYQVINAIQYKSNPPHSPGRALNSAYGIAFALLGIVGAIAISSKEQTNNIKNLKEKESTNTNDNENIFDFVDYPSRYFNYIFGSCQLRCGFKFGKIL